MKQFTMSQYAAKEDLYKAKAEYLERQLRWIAGQDWFKREVSFRFDIEGYDFDDTECFFHQVSDAIDKKLDNKKC